MSEANESKVPEWWTAMLTPEGQRDLAVLGDMRSSFKDCQAAVAQIEQRKDSRDNNAEPIA